MTGVEIMSNPFPVPLLRSMDGAAELAVAEAIAGARSRPESVTAVLAALLETIGGEAVTPEVARALPSATREWLLQWAAHHLNPDIHWFEARCEHCGEPYDLSIDLSGPVCVAANRPATQVTVETSLGTRSFKVPTGEHEERLARLAVDSDDPRRDFAAICGMTPEAEDEAEQLDEHDLELIDEALEAASPDVADQVTTTCPACKARTGGRIDPLRFAFPHEGGILGEVHLIAGAYGWRPEDILTLNVRHRSHLAEMIARERRGGRRRQ